MKTRRIYLWIALVTVVGLVLSACAAPKSKTDASEGTPYKVGFCAAITGGGSSLGVPERNTAEMLAEQYADGVTGPDGEYNYIDGETVTFRYKDRSDHNKTKITRLDALTFTRRFLAHVLPERFVRIRHYGLLATRATKLHARALTLIGKPLPPPPPEDSTWADAFLRIFGRDPLLCPACHQARLIERPVFRPLRL